MAGFPSPADDYINLKLNLNDYPVKRPCATYYAKASGDSITGASILDGDVIVVDRSIAPLDRKIIHVALSREFTLMCTRYKGSEAMFYPVNDKYPVTELSKQEDFRFWGVLTGMVRKL